MKRTKREGRGVDGYVHGSVEGSDSTALLFLHVPSCSLQGMKGGLQPIGI